MTDPSQKENLGIIVQYRVKVKLCLGPLGGDVVAELPFVLMHPKPEDDNIPPKSETNPDGEPTDGEAPKTTKAEPNLIQLET